MRASGPWNVGPPASNGTGQPMETASVAAASCRVQSRGQQQCQESAARQGGAAGAENTVFVGGISSNCSEDQLKEEFERVGKVSSVSIIMDRDTGQPKGFGFVAFVHPEDANRALLEMEGAGICGNAVHLRPRRARVPLTEA
mmetsp:Transcript_63863/g.164391  ORF Transcript_63863/g.164391 Transcript_63863/m.164391 type:complete len:142 (+) Transcript_63863:140-565(+)